MKNKILMSIPILALLFVSFASASMPGAFSLRDVDNNPWDINVNSNGITGNGYLIDGNVGYSLYQTGGTWFARLQVGRIRGNWFPVTVNYDAVSGIFTIPGLGISANVINLI